MKRKKKKSFTKISKNEDNDDETINIQTSELNPKKKTKKKQSSIICYLSLVIIVLIITSLIFIMTTTTTTLTTRETQFNFNDFLKTFETLF
jgi:uncharacterized membrane protein